MQINRANKLNMQKPPTYTTILFITLTSFAPALRKLLVRLNFGDAK